MLGHCSLPLSLLLLLPCLTFDWISDFDIPLSLLFFFFFFFFFFSSSLLFSSLLLLSSVDEISNLRICYITAEELMFAVDVEQLVQQLAEMNVYVRTT